METTRNARSLADVTHELRDGYVLFRVTGPCGGSEAQREIWGRIAREAGKVGARRILVIEDLPTSGFGGVLDAVAAAVAQGIGRFRVAFVDLREGAQAFAEFGAVLARNRGVDARVFATEAEAERWLLLAEGPSVP